MDGLGGCYAKWNKLDKERQILYDITCMLNLKSEFIEKNRLVVARSGGGKWEVGEMGEGCQKVQTSRYKINKSWGWKVQHNDFS